MAHQVLARKWRPKTFDEVAGQAHVVRILTSSLQNHSLHQAYLFTGTRGVGKTTLARIFARCLNCREAVGATPCGTCISCTEIDQSCHQDLIEVDAATHTGVDEIRKLLEDSYYPPVSARYKIYLIDEVHMLSGSSFNAMLKTLEEPPEHIMFLLATTEAQKVLPTVLSRCLQLSLKGLPLNLISERLQQVLTEEGIAHDAGSLAALARAARGSMRDALTLTDQAIGFGDGALCATDVHRMLGTLDGEVLQALIKALFARDAEQVMAVVDSISASGSDYERALEDLLEALHAVAMVQLLKTYDRSRLDNERIRQLAATVTAEDVQLFYQIGLLARRDMALTADSRQGLEMTLLRMLAFTQDPAAAQSEQPLSGTGSGSVDAMATTVAETPEATSGSVADTSTVPPQPVDSATATLGATSEPVAETVVTSPESIDSDVSATRPQHSDPANSAAVPSHDAEGILDLVDLDANTWSHAFFQLSLSPRARAHLRDTVLIAVEGCTLKLCLTKSEPADVPRAVLEELTEAVRKHWAPLSEVSLHAGVDGEARQLTPQWAEEQRVRAIPEVQALEAAFGIETLSIDRRADDYS